MGDDLADSFNIEPVDYPQIHHGKGTAEVPERVKKLKAKRRRITEEEPSELKKLAQSSDILDIYHDHVKEQKLSPLELDDLRLPQSAVSMHRSHNFMKLLAKLPFQPDKFPRCKNEAMTIIVCSGAIRCLEIIKLLRSSKYSELCHISKMFAAHIKIPEQQKVLEKFAVHVCVGTPNRLKKLVSEGYLGVNKCQYVIVDYNWRDSKLKRIVDIPETKIELVSLLMQINASLKGNNKIVLL